MFVLIVHLFGVLTLYQTSVCVLTSPEHLFVLKIYIEHRFKCTYLLIIIPNKENFSLENRSQMIIFIK